MKLVAFIQAPAGADQAAYKRWYLETFAPSLLCRVPGLAGLTVNVIRQAETLYDYEGAGGPEVADIYAEFWLQQDRVVTAGEFAPPEGRQQMFRVEERIEKAELDRAPGVMAGIRLLSPLYPIEGAQPAQSVGFWDRHVPLALRIHVGMSRYVRDIVLDVMGEEPSPVFGVASLHFPSDEAIRDRFFDSPESIPEHAADLACFVGKTVPMSAISHVII